MRSFSFPGSTPVSTVFFSQDERVQIITHVRPGRKNCHTPGSTQGSKTNAPNILHPDRYVQFALAVTLDDRCALNIQKSHFFPALAMCSFNHGNNRGSNFFMEQRQKRALHTFHKDFYYRSIINMFTQVFNSNCCFEADVLRPNCRM